MARRSRKNTQHRFVGSFEIWITRKNIKNLHLRIQPPDGRIEISAPTSLPDDFIDNFVASKADWILDAQRRILANPSPTFADVTEEEKQQWKRLVSEIVPMIVAHYEPILNVKAGKLAYRCMKSRWGSCQPATGRICINTRLALYPPECLEYVVVHELCHLRESGHGPAFKNLMTEVMPDWKERRKLLRDYRFD